MPSRPAVVLVRPQEEGNVGAVARAMANMGLSRLLLVEPAPPLGPSARAFAVGAGDVLEASTRHHRLEEALAPFQRIVGTTSARGRELGREPLSPRELPALLRRDPARTRGALVFGPEASGLTRDELALCDPLVRIPAAPRQPTLNLAQAVLIVAYELHCQGAGVGNAGEPLAAAEQVEGLFGQVASLLERAEFARDDTFEGVLRDLRELAARAALREREVAILRGVCRRISNALARGPGG